jgi:hypothetical protein
MHIIPDKGFIVAIKVRKVGVVAHDVSGMRTGRVKDVKGVCRFLGDWSTNVATVT